MVEQSAENVRLHMTKHGICMVADLRDWIVGQFKQLLQAQGLVIFLNRISLFIKIFLCCSRQFQFNRVIDGRELLPVA